MECKDIKDMTSLIFPAVGWLLVWLGWRNTQKVSKQAFQRQQENNYREQLIKQLEQVKEIARNYYCQNIKDYYRVMEQLDMANIFANHHGYFDTEKENCLNEWIDFKRSITDKLIESKNLLYDRDSELVKRIDYSYKVLYTAVLNIHKQRLEEI